VVIMSEAVAWLLLRMQMRLMDEGIGPRVDDPTDGPLLDEAMRLAGHRLSDAERYEYFS
jgi:hypothetical protein